jgi:hypothetical protein
LQRKTRSMTRWKQKPKGEQQINEEKIEPLASDLEVDSKQKLKTE